MTHEIESPLPPAPREPVDAAGMPRLGRYHGAFQRIDWSARLPGWAGRLDKIRKEKRWIYGCVSTAEIFCGYAIVDIGYAANAFVFVADLLSGRLIDSASFVGVPGLNVAVGAEPEEGARAHFVSPGARFHLSRPAGTTAWVVQIESRTIHLEGVFDTSAAPSPASVVMSLSRGVTATQKSNLLPATGTLKVGDQRFDLAGGFAGFDYSCGLLPRKTTWRWAFAQGRAPDGTPVGINLSDGLSAERGAENVMWWGRELLPLGPARFAFDAKNHEAPWQVRTEDGALDLRFTPAGLFREERNLLLLRSRFIQVAGTFAGALRSPLGEIVSMEAWPGVTEDQFVVW